VQARDILASLYVNGKENTVALVREGGDQTVRHWNLTWHDYMWSVCVHKARNSCSTTYTWSGRSPCLDTHGSS
jgi:hypothetical protein